MSIAVLIAAAFVICGILFLAWAALGRRPLSDPHEFAGAKPTLEPRGQGLRFLGLIRNALGISLIVAGLAIFVIYAWQA